MVLALGWILTGNQVAHAQKYAGYWLGVTYPSDPQNAVFNYFANFTQSGTKIGGTGQTANPTLPFGGVAYLNGTATTSSVKYVETDAQGTFNTNNICYFDVDLVYNAAEESLKGTYKYIQNPGYCEQEGGGKIELYRIVLKSGVKYCKGKPVDLTVTGKNIRWYDSADKKRLLAQGNNFSPPITETTTYYITQTLYKSESPTIPIKVEIVDLVLVSIGGGPVSCGKQDGTLVVTALGGAEDKQFSIDSGSSYQASNRFAGLAEGNYKVKVRDNAGCSVEGQASVQPANLSIKSVDVRNPTCGLANGSLTVKASGADPRYSLDGTNFKRNNIFENLAGGEYTISVKDTFACPVTTKATLASAGVPQTVTARPTPTTCGQDNGEIAITTSAANPQFSLDGNVFKPGDSFRNLAAGDYTVTMKDTAGCIATSKTTIAVSDGPRIGNVAATPVSCGQANGRLNVQATGNGLRYALDSGSTRPTGTFEALEAREYEITVTDANNCVTRQKVSMVSDCRNMVFIPSGFSPNGDGRNDQLTAHFTPAELTFKSITVYNRWGIAVHSRQNALLRSGDVLWDGKFEDASPIADLCVVVAEVLFDDGTTHVFRQSVEILR